ncbi:hypothetical protein GCM10023195_70030 [Actinoallomurus liliacearum]|uniref:Uncharacterized protein n=1 Tax=Actinoallomurus liliacearum TaxID=1080073 RepID=A0ABP8TVN7_9ACTN
MFADDVELWDLLRSLDDSEHLESPAGYDHQRVRARFERLVQRLDGDFNCRCGVDRNVQDAALHGRIELPAHATATRRPLVMSISNFGDLAVLSLDEPGVWTDAEMAELLHPDDAHRSDSALADLGYRLIPEKPLWRRYDGVWDPAVFAPQSGTWWIRFFDYL